MAIDGGADFTFGIAPVWIGARHPELGWHVVDGGTAFQPGTAAYAFARSGIPTLRFHSVAGGSVPAGPPQSRAAGPMASALRLAFYVAQEVANADGSVQWTEAGRAQYVDPLAGQP